MSRELTAMQRELDRAILRLQFLRAQADTLHSMAYEGGGATVDGTPRSTKQHHYGDEVGRRDVRRGWVILSAWVLRSGGQLTAIVSGFERILAEGKQDEALRGSTITLEEFAQARHAQKARGGGNRNQPGYPKGR